MARTLQALFGGKVLSPASRAKLTAWMMATSTGSRRIRAGLPRGWQSGDKTGTGLFDRQPSHYVDLAVATAPSGRRIVIAGFISTTLPQSSADPAFEALLARIGEISVEWLDERGGQQ
jgi:beta-lactamase class A